MGKNNLLSFGQLKENIGKENQAIQEFEKQPLNINKQHLIGGGLLVGGILLAGMFFINILSGIVAAIALIGFGIAAKYGFKALKDADPIIQDKIKRKLIQVRIAEARDNAIEHLKLQIIERHKVYEQKKAGLVEMEGHLSKLKMKLGTSKNEKTNKSLQTMYDAAKKAVDLVTKNVKMVYKNNKSFEDMVEDYKLKDEFADIADKLNTMAGDSKVNEMLTLEAFDAIDTDYCNAVAEIDAASKIAEIEGE